MDGKTWITTACMILSFGFMKCDEFRILVLLPSTDSKDWKFAFGTEMSGPAALIAIDEVNRQGLLGGHILAADFADTRCNPVIGLGVAVDAMMATNYSCLIGPPCSAVCANVATLAAYRNIPVFNGVCQAIEMLDKSKYKTLTRLLGTFDLVGEATTSFIHFNNWTRISIIAENHADSIWKLSRDGVNFLAKKTNITVSSVITIGEPTQFGDLYTATQSLDKSAEVSRIIVITVRGNTFRELMLHAYDRGFINGSYVFICVNFYTQKRVYGDYNWFQNDSRDADAKKAYNGVFWVNYFEPSTQEYSSFQSHVQQMAQSTFGFEYRDNENTPYQAANLYEAVWMYANSLNETLAVGGSISDGTRISQRLWGRSYPGKTGDVSFNMNGDREQGYTVLQTKPDGNRQEVGYYFSRKGYYEASNTNLMHWPSGKTSPPSDFPVCGWEGELCVAEDAAEREFKVMLGTLLSVFFVVLVAACMGIGVVYRKLKWQKEVGDMKWKIKYDDVIINKPTRQLSLSALSLNTYTTNMVDRSRIQLGFYDGATVAMRRIKPAPHSLPQSDLQELKQMHDLSHVNVVRFIGACLDSAKCYLIQEFCTKESLEDMLSNEDIKLDWSFKHSLIQDTIQGLLFLKGSALKHHGNLKTSNCLLDSRFVVKLSDFGLRNLIINPDERKPKDLLWTAPELLRLPYLDIKDKEAIDIYSFGIILQEILLRQGPFFNEDFLEADEIISRVSSGVQPLVRPKIEKHDCPPQINDLVLACWEEEPANRIRLQDFRYRIRQIAGNKGQNLMDSLLQRMEAYANNLESIVEQRTTQYLDEKRRVEELLYRLLPKSIADQLQTNGFVEPEAFNCVTIYFSDIVGFTSISADSKPLEVVDMLNDLYMCFDTIIDSFNVYKVETIGDAYMVVSGLPNKTDTHAQEIADMSLKIRNAVSLFKIRHRPNMSLKLRIGIDSGSVVAGVVGVKMPRYCLFGDTVNTASRMESSGEAVKIHVSSRTATLLACTGLYDLEMRGEIQIKGKGKMITQWLLGKLTSGDVKTK